MYNYFHGLFLAFRRQQLEGMQQLGNRVQQQQPARAPARTARSSVVAGAGSNYGTLFRVSTFGESHGKGVGCVVDGVPPRLPISEDEIQVGRMLKLLNAR